MRDNGNWIEPTIHIIMIIAAILAVAGLFVVAHFVIKHW